MVFIKYTVRSVIAGIALGVGFVLPILWPIVIFGVALFIQNTFDARSLLYAMWGGFVAWFIKYLFAISWFLSAYPVDWLVVDIGPVEPIIIGLYWTNAATALAVGGSVVSGVLKVAGQRYVLALPVWLVIGEVVGSYTFAIASYGPGATIDASFSFGYVGYLLAQHDLLVHVATYGGVYLLTFLVGLLAVGAWFVLKTPTTKNISIGVFGVVAVVGLQAVQLETIEAVESVRVGIIDTDFPDTISQQDNELILRRSAIDAAASALSDDIEYLIAPEDVRYGGVPNNLAQEAFFIDSARVTVDGGYSIRAFIYASSSIQMVDKQYLVPQGEFMPSIYANSLALLGFNHIFEAINYSTGYIPGPLKSQRTFSAATPGVLFCFESVSPFGVKRLMAERSVPFIAHPISHSWFHEPYTLWHQLDTMLTVQSIWNQVSIVSAANHAHGSLYTPDGRVARVQYTAEGEYWQTGVVAVPLYR